MLPFKTVLLTRHPAANESGLNEGVMSNERNDPDEFGPLPRNTASGDCHFDNR